jgi:CheY-like chemotaxis protein
MLQKPEGTEIKVRSDVVRNDVVPRDVVPRDDREMGLSNTPPGAAQPGGEASGCVGLSFAQRGAATSPARAATGSNAVTAKTAPASSRAPGDRLSESSGLTRRAVMIIDDDDAIREALEDVLSDEGYEVVGVSDGQQALDYLHGEKRPHAILVDLWMPVMDGWKFLDALLEDPRLCRIPLVVLTAARDQRARDLRVAEVLTKPVQLQQVLGALERLTGVS